MGTVIKDHFEMDEFLLQLLLSRSPTGAEREAADVVEEYVKPCADSFERDVIGNRIASIGKGSISLMLAGHMDEIGLMISYIDDDGFLFFEPLGGHDNSMLSGRRVAILSKRGTVYGTTGKKAVHMMDTKERKEVPEIHQIWIDIGAKSRAEAEKLVRVGDPAVYDVGVRHMQGRRCTARAFDDRCGCYCAFETLRRLSPMKDKLKCRLVSVATTQEEIGTRGANVAAYAVNPKIGIAIDVGHATDFPGCDKRKYGDIKLGAGVMIARGPNINNVVFDRLVSLAESENIPFQISPESRPTGTDARVLQMARSGVATGLLSVPLRYMHTPGEMVDLDDVENCVKLLQAFALSVSADDDFTY